MANIEKKYLISFALVFIGISTGICQFGRSIINIDFGIGNNDPNTIGSPLPRGYSEFVFGNKRCPDSGQYTIARRVDINGCFNDTWIPLSYDNTPAQDLGNMMIINSFSGGGERILFRDTVNETLCPGTVYRFSAAFINLDRPSNCSSNFPSITFSIENNSGTELAHKTYSGLSYADATFGYKFSNYFVDYLLPSGLTGLVVKIKVAHYNDLVGRECGDDFAVDDISFYANGPKATVGFTGVEPGNLVKSVCFQDNKTISMNGNVEAFYTQPAIQWEQSSNNGLTWQDVPAANTNDYSRSFSLPDTFLFRIRSAEINDISNPHCGVVSNIIKVEVDDIPQKYKATVNSPVCSGGNLLFDAEGGVSYEWTGPNGFYDNIKFPHIFFSRLKDSGWYYVQISSLGGCKVRDSVYATVIGTDVEAGPDTSICKGSSYFLSVNEGVSYSWTPKTSLDNPASRTPKASPIVSTMYTVTLKDRFGCTDTAQQFIVVKNNTELVADIKNNEYVCQPNDSISFVDNSRGEITEWHWDFGNGKTSKLSNPATQYYYSVSGFSTIPVKLTVKDKSGCESTKAKSLKVVNLCTVMVPNAFTPNNDGSNDWLYPLNAYKATNLKFSVFNRYGQLIFSTQNWQIKWNGEINNSAAPTGLYLWVLEYIDASRKRIVTKGTTLLIR